MDIITAQLNYTVGDLVGNANKIIEAVHKKTKYYERDSLTCEAVMVFSELCISGYPPLDLLDSKEFIREQEEALNHILKETAASPLTFVVGFIEENKDIGKPLRNALAVCRGGDIIFKYYKRLLPTYDIFDEDRYFEPGAKSPVFNLYGIRVGFAICEDLWPTQRYRVNPVEQLYQNNAEIVISINASPSIAGKHEQRLDLIKGFSDKYNMPIVYVNQVGGNDDIVFDGNSFVMHKGRVLYHSPSFEEDAKFVRVVKSPGGVMLGAPIVYKYEVPRSNAYLNRSCVSFYLQEDAEFFARQAVLGIHDYIKKSGFKKVVIGESGGIDSAVTTAIAAIAIGPENVIAVTMPSQYSSEGSVNDSQELCDKFGVGLLNIPIKEQFEAFMKVFGEKYSEVESGGVTEQNVQARIRGQILMAISNRENALVLSTGNKSELSVGYCTIYGDMCGGINPIADCYKMEVYAIGKYLGVPDSIMDKAPSAELAPGQMDTDSLPPYPILDNALRCLIEGEQRSLDLGVALSKHGWSLEKIYYMLRNNEFKRRQAAVGIKMHKKAFGFGRRYPIINKFSPAAVNSVSASDPIKEL